MCIGVFVFFFLKIYNNPICKNLSFFNLKKIYLHYNIQYLIYAITSLTEIGGPFVQQHHNAFIALKYNFNNWQRRKKEGNALNIFYLRLYDIRHMVERAQEKTHCHHYMGFSFKLAAHTTHRIAHTMAFVMSVME